MAEYTLVLALIAIACIGSVLNTSSTVRSKLNVDFESAVNHVPTVNLPIPGDTGVDTAGQGDDAADSNQDPARANHDPIHNPKTGGAAGIEDKF
jgi:hypothetical protein